MITTTQTGTFLIITSKTNSSSRDLEITIDRIRNHLMIIQVINMFQIKAKTKNSLKETTMILI